MRDAIEIFENFFNTIVTATQRQPQWLRINNKRLSIASAGKLQTHSLGMIDSGPQ